MKPRAINREANERKAQSNCRRCHKRRTKLERLAYSQSLLCRKCATRDNILIEIYYNVR